MKFQSVFIVAICALAWPSQAQQSAAGGSPPGTNAVTLHSASFLSSPLSLDSQPPRAEVIEGKRFQVTGPLVAPLKAKQVWEFPGRLLQLINPFAKSAPKPEAQSVGGDVSPRAWSTTVGWHPGGSAFPDEMTHEPSLTLIAVKPKPND